MGNFKKVDLLSSTSKLSLGENEIDVVITGSTTPNYIVLNKRVVDLVIKKGSLR